MFLCAQGQLGAARQYNGALDALRKIVANEGVFALWKGIVPALVRQASYGSLRYGLYAPIKQAITTGEVGKESMFVKLVAGAGSGALASAVANPTGLSNIFVVTRTRLQAMTVPLLCCADLVKVRMQVRKGSHACPLFIVLLGRLSLSACVLVNTNLPPHMHAG